MAPELGLFLDECVFKSYNDRWGNDREAQVSLGDFQEQVDAFKARATREEHASAAMHMGLLYCACVSQIDVIGVVQTPLFRQGRLQCMLC